ncbi:MULTISPECIES: helix-turn-helix transcriptional regulator [Rhodomicrobium]|uniref:helix-turn-helix transcriptional regulator n=1 Tax=Rhodomicrobium TaxID=1068 RepID=UPI000B4AA536|nr:MULTISPECIES: helix-turn-helix transcriptional regulator [Rhodomicrobium]
MELLTTTEAADYLRIKERKLYELVAERQIPCTKVTGKWVFPRAELDRWLLAGMARPLGLTPADPPPIIGGSHDPLLQWALLESRCELASLAEGSEAGFAKLLQGKVVAAAIHFHDVEDPDADANIAAVQSEPQLYDAVLVGFAIREQGLLLASGNPLGIVDLESAAASGARFATRPDGAGAQQLLHALLNRQRLQYAKLTRASGTAPTGADIAQAIRGGHADCGIATRSIAASAGLDFLSLAHERFDLLLRQRDYFRPPMQAMLGLLADPRFAARATELGGLDVTGAGRIRWAP